nr:hypothetical protein [Tanacetum cinerariifolium]
GWPTYGPGSGTRPALKPAARGVPASRWRSHRGLPAAGGSRAWWPRPAARHR